MSVRRMVCVLAISLATMAFPGSPSALAASVDLSAPTNAYTVGNGLARSTGHLQALWASDCPPRSGKCATDSGPHAGVFWQRSKTTGWSTPLRLSPGHQHTARPALAASGPDVYAAFVSQTRYIHYKPSARRVLSVRVSTNEGKTWSGSVALSPSRGRVDYPVIAASGSRAWIVWTDANTGAIRMASTNDDGANWSTKTLGATTSGQGTAEGFRGYPSIGASGVNVAVVWIADADGRTVALVSSSRGTEWSNSSVPVELTATSPADEGHYPAAHGADDGQSSRVAIGYTTDNGLESRVFDGVLLTDAATVAGPWTETVGGRTFAGAFGPAVAPSGTSDLGVAWAACERRAKLADPCNSSSSKARIDVVERTSDDDGATWAGATIVGRSVRSARINEAPSIEVDGAGARSIMWLRRTANWSSYRVYLTQP